jgi:hypothetical protein
LPDFLIFALAALRRKGENYSSVILRLAADFVASRVDSPVYPR